MILLKFLLHGAVIIEMHLMHPDLVDEGDVSIHRTRKFWKLKIKPRGQIMFLHLKDVPEEGKGYVYSNLIKL